MELRDGMGRGITYLRLSVTDRCNQRCVYCMPEDGVELFPHDRLLRLEELVELTDRFARLFWINKVRLTGGEPLIRRNIEGLVEMLARIPAIDDLAMTTNGVLLTEKARVLFDAGLRRINVSVDSLDPDRYRAVTGFGELDEVLEGLSVAREMGFSPIKVNVVLLPGFDEEVKFVEWANSEGYQVRFIELMPHFHGSAWNIEGEGPKEEQVLDRLTKRFDLVEEDKNPGEEPGRHARRYRIPDRNWVFEFIPGVTVPFCGDCNRLRLDCQGELRFCLYSNHTLQLRPLLDVSDAEFVRSIQGFVEKKTERMLDHIGSNMFAIGG